MTGTLSLCRNTSVCIGNTFPVLELRIYLQQYFNTLKGILSGQTITINVEMISTNNLVHLG